MKIPITGEGYFAVAARSNVTYITYQAEKDDRRKMVQTRGACPDNKQLPGDSRRQERRSAILDAAEALFLEQGFVKASLGAVVRRSGGSLATLYDMFGNKRGLLHAVLYRRRDEHMREFLEPDTATAPRADLCQYALGCYAFITAPRTIALLRIAIGESISDPEFARELQLGLNTDALQKLASIFRQWAATGRARIEDADAAAELFFAMVLCDAPIRAMLGVVPPEMDAERMSRRLAPFLNHYAIAESLPGPQEK